MGIQVALNHRTQYRYDKAVSLGPQVIRLRPAPHCRTPILSYSLNVTPAEHLLNWQFDLHNNHLARVLFPEKTNEFVVEVDLVAELSPFNPFDFFLEPGVEDYPFEYAPELAKDLEPYRSVEPAGPLLQAFLGKPSREKRGTIGFLVDLNRRVRDEIDYVTRLDPGVQTCEQTLEKRTGSCRDSAWLLVQILRHLGIAARFVSGYLIQLAADESAPEGPSGPQTDSADFHAWAEAFLPGAGWIGMDPTSGLFAGEGHIPLVCTPNASKAAPIEGTVEPANVDFSYSMSIRRLNDAPRPSKPFTDEDWLQVEQVAHRVDADLEAQDVRLTMGGEPTFVGIDEPESPQWNIDALGPMKRTRGLALIQCLREKDGARRTASLRTRQMVSGRAAAALGAELLLARRRRPGLGECRSHRSRRSGLQLRRGRCFQVHGSAHASPSGELRKHAACLQRRSRVDGAGRIHFAHSPPSTGGPVVLVEPVVVSSPGTSVAVAGRFAHRLSHTDRVDALGGA